MSSIAEMQGARDYLADRLSAAEREAFEARLARSPELVAELELALRMREGLTRLAERGELEALVAAAPRPRWPWIAAALAATVAGLAVSFWAWQSRPAPVLSASVARGAGASGEVALVAAQWTFRAMRSGGALALQLPASGLVELRVVPANADPVARYTLVLERLGAGRQREPVGELAGLAADEQGFVAGYAASSRLGPGRYELRLTSDRPRLESETFAFVIAAPDATRRP